MIRAKSFFDLRDDCVRIFFAGIIRSNNPIIGILIDHLPHEWSFLSIAITATSENNDKTSGRKFAQSFDDIQKGVIGMRIIYEDLELSFCGHSFEASGNLWRSRQAEDCFAQIDSHTAGGS